MKLKDGASIALTHDMMPTKERIMIALKRDVSEQTVMNISEMNKRMLPKTNNEKVWANIFTNKPERSQVLVHAATTQEIIEQKKGSIAYQEFPGGTVKLAKTILR